MLSGILVSRLVIPAKSASHVICRSADQEKMCMPLPAMVSPGTHPLAHKTMLTCVQEMLSELGQEGLQTLLEGGLVFSDLEGALASLPVGVASLSPTLPVHLTSFSLLPFHERRICVSSFVYLSPRAFIPVISFLPASLGIVPRTCMIVNKLHTFHHPLRPSTN